MTLIASAATVALYGVSSSSGHNYRRCYVKETTSFSNKILVFRGRYFKCHWSRSHTPRLSVFWKEMRMGLETVDLMLFAASTS